MCIYIHIYIKCMYFFNFTFPLTGSLLPFTDFVWTSCVFIPLYVDSFALQVQNISVTHTFRIDKARNQLGYSPEKFVFADSVDHYIKTRPEAQNDHIFLKVLLLLIVSLSLIFLSLRFDDLSVLHFFKETKHWHA